MSHGRYVLEHRDGTLIKILSVACTNKSLQIHVKKKKIQVHSKHTLRMNENQGKDT